MSSQCLSSLNVLSAIFLLGVDSHDGSLQLGQFDVFLFESILHKICYLLEI